MKKVVVIIITVLILLPILLYLVGLGAALLVTDVPIIARGVILIGFLILAFIVYAIGKVFSERMKEIDEEDEDDLSKY